MARIENGAARHGPPQETRPASQPERGTVVNIVTARDDAEVQRALARAAAELIACSDRLDAALARKLAAELAGYQRGFADGREAGYRQGRQDEADQWFAALAPAREAARAIARGPDRAELELMRWGPGGRKHFGDPRPGDFPGIGTA